MSSEQVLEAVLLITHGYALWDRLDTLDPKTTVLSQAQWLEIAERLRGTGNALRWMNVGPSGDHANDTVMSQQDRLDFIYGGERG